MKLHRYIKHINMAHIWYAFYKNTIIIQYLRVMNIYEREQIFMILCFG
jgi:hypothetical protein